MKHAKAKEPPVSISAPRLWGIPYPALIINNYYWLFAPLAAGMSLSRTTRGESKVTIMFSGDIKIEQKVCCRRLPLIKVWHSLTADEG